MRMEKKEGEGEGGKKRQVGIMGEDGRRRGGREE